jgi:1-acyl-sn-glycerol-3-phosphate acyltransferase
MSSPSPAPAVGASGLALPPAGPVYRRPSGSLPFRVAQAFCRFAFTTLFDVKLWGVEHVPPTGGVLLVSNHQSILDPVLLGLGLPRPLSYMAKSELFEGNALFDKLIRSLGAFPVRQGGSATGAIKETIERLQEGRALNIFPEGSRTDTGEVADFQNGIALVVRKAKVPVVPAAISGSFEAFPNGTKYPVRKPIRVMYGPPMLLHDRKPDQIVSALRAEVQRMFEQVQAMNPNAATDMARAMERARRGRAEKKRRRARR